MAVRGELLIVGLLTLLSSGCAPQPPRYRPPVKTEGQVHVYLQPLPQEVQRLSFSISALSAVRENGEHVDLPRLVSEVQGKDLVGVQRRLASAVLPPGIYKGLAMEIARASVLGEEGPADLVLPEEPLMIEEEFTVARATSRALFLSLGPADWIQKGVVFTPTFSLAKSRHQLMSILGFVTNTQSNLVSVFNKHTMEIVDTIATGSGPMGAVIDPRRGWVYLAIAGEDAVEAIEVNTGEILRRLKLNFGDEPIELALSPDGSTLVSANRGTNSVSIINAESLRETVRLSLSAEPTALISGGSTSRVYVIQQRSNAISSIDAARREVVATQILDDTPLRGAVSSDGNTLYVVSRYSSDLLVIDAQTLSERGRIFVGSGATSIRVDRKSDLIYVGNKSSGISVLDPRSLVPIDRFRLSGYVEFLAIDDDENALFVLLPELQRVQKLDLVSKKQRAAIEVAEGGYSVVLMGER